MYCGQRSTLRRLNFGPKDGEDFIPRSTVHHLDAAGVASAT
jgi:hypothetical protein